MQKLVTIIILIVLSMLLLDVFKLIHGYEPPPFDARAHIFRTIYFYQGMINGDYAPIQYHGYSFLAGYGILTYVISYSIFRFLTTLNFASILSAIYAFNTILVFAPVILAFSAVELANEIKKMSFPFYLVFTILIIFLPTTFFEIAISGTVPYVYSFAFSLLGLKYIIRIKNGDAETKTLMLAYLFSILSIYTETFGYIFTLINLLALYPRYKKIAKLSLLILISTSFSWVQLLEVFKYMTPFNDFGARNFIVLYLEAVAIFLIYTLIEIKVFKALKKDTLYKIAFLYLTLVGLAVANSFYGLNLGPLNSIIVNIMPARLTFVCFAIFLLTSFITNLANRIALGKRRILLGASICIIMAFFVAFTITFSLPNTYYAPWPQNNLNLLSNHKVLVPPPAIYTINSSGVFAPLLNYSTTTGAYNQGDPSFYYLTVYYEWMSAFVNRTPSFLNIMQMTGSNAIIPMRNYSIYRENANFLGYSNGFPTYGLNSSLADSVTPIRIYAANQTEALRFSLFVNILANNGFSYVFTTQPVANTTDYVIFSDYNGTVQLNSTSKIIHVVNSSLNELVEVNSTDYILYTTALKESISIFPYNLYFPNAYFDNSSESIPNSMITNATFIANSLTAVFHPIYKPLGYSTGKNSYTVNQSNLPVLLKVSYYPYFTTSSNSTYTYDINHLMLLPAQGRVTIIWHLPLYEAAALISIISIILSVFYLTEGKNTLHYLKRAAKNPHQKIFK